MASERVGLLLIRAWVEPGSAAPLRARIQKTSDLSSGLDPIETVVDAERVLEAVRLWMADVLTGTDESAESW
jgi:hypothetical protein